MSRPLARAARAFATPRRGILTPSSSAPRQSSSPAQGGVDPRIFAQGVDNFIQKPQFDRLNEWQAGLWERLQSEVRNNPALAPIRLKWDNDRLDMTELLAFTAREANLALAFNYASLLLNNSYFLESINPETPKAVPEHFKSLEDRVAAYADGMVGSGWLWLVKAGDGLADFDVVPTFGSGTMLVTMRQQRGRHDTLPVFLTPPTTGGEADKGAASPPINDATSEKRAEWRNARAGSEATPLAVLNLFEHAYLGERYGVFGRSQYARDWFKALDWDKVSKRTAQGASW